MACFWVCLLITAGLQVARPLSLSSTLEDGVVRTELFAPTPRIVQFVGRSILLQCWIHNSQNGATSWSKILSVDGTSSLQISNGTEFLVQDSRYTLAKDSATSTMNLQIQNLQMTDVGLYQCTIISPDGFRRSKRIEVQVFQ